MNRVFEIVGVTLVARCRVAAAAARPVAVVRRSSRLVDSGSHTVRSGADDRGGSSGECRRQKGASADEFCLQ
jgi:hypothetical protein